jgi:hypothetical protein
MAPLTPEELQADIRESALLPEYGKPIDRESARELLAARLAGTTIQRGEEPPVTGSSRSKGDRTMSEMAGDVVQSPLGKTVVREVVRGLFGLLGMKAPRRTTATRRRRW